MTLLRRLKEIENNDEVSTPESFVKKIQHIKSYCEEISAIFIEKYPHFTCHDHRHSEVVINRLNDLCQELMAPDNPNSLNYTEIFCLLASAYLHDTGMIYSKKDDLEKIRDFNKTNNDNTLTVNDLMRMEHHIRSGDYIYENRKFLKLDVHLTRVIGKISKGHRKVDLNNKEFKYRTINEETVRIRLLAAFLRLADELDVSHSRITDELHKIFDAEHGYDFLSQIHFMKHLYTAGINIGKEDRGVENTKTVNISITVPDDDYERKMVAIIKGPIQREIKYTQPFFLEVGLKVKLNKIDCDYDKNMYNIPDIVFYRFYKPHKRKMKILIVDDKIEYRNAFKDILKNEGYFIEMASDSNEAISKINKREYDQVLLDIIMETDDAGLNILENIMQSGEFNGTIFMITVLDDAKTALASKKLGAEEYFIKEELNVSELRTKVNEAFEKRFDIISMRN